MTRLEFERRRLRILEYIESHPDAKANEVADACECTPSQAQTVLSDLAGDVRMQADQVAQQYIDDLFALVKPAIETLGDALKCEHKPGHVAIAAARDVLDRTIGRAVERIGNPDGSPLQFSGGISFEQFAAAFGRLARGSHSAGMEDPAEDSH